MLIKQFITPKIIDLGRELLKKENLVFESLKRYVDKLKDIDKECQ